MEFPALRLMAFLLLAGIDTGIAVYYRYIEVDTKVGYAAHAAGAAVGLLLGIVVLRNLRVKTWERVMCLCSRPCLRGRGLRPLRGVWCMGTQFVAFILRIFRGFLPVFNNRCLGVTILHR